MGQQMAGQMKDACKTGSRDPGVSAESYTSCTARLVSQGLGRERTAAEHRISGSAGLLVYSHGQGLGAMGNQVIADRTIPDFQRKSGVLSY